jgi:hypothetical protein
LLFFAGGGWVVTCETAATGGAGRISGGGRAGEGECLDLQWERIV